MGKRGRARGYVPLVLRCEEPHSNLDVVLDQFQRADVACAKILELELEFRRRRKEINKGRVGGRLEAMDDADYNDKLDALDAWWQEAISKIVADGGLLPGNRKLLVKEAMVLKGEGMVPPWREGIGGNAILVLSGAIKKLTGSTDFPEVDRRLQVTQKVVRVRVGFIEGYRAEENTPVFTELKLLENSYAKFQEAKKGWRCAILLRKEGQWSVELHRSETFLYLFKTTASL